MHASSPNAYKIKVNNYRVDMDKEVVVTVVERLDQPPQLPHSPAIHSENKGNPHRLVSWVRGQPLQCHRCVLCGAGKEDVTRKFLPHFRTSGHPYNLVPL